MGSRRWNPEEEQKLLSMTLTERGVVMKDLAQVCE